MKLFVTDIDDTLTVGETVSGEVCRACARLREAGWDIMIATGRTFGMSKNHMRAIGVTQPALLYDGGRTMTPAGREIRSTLMDPALTAALLRSLWNEPFEVQVAGDEVIYCRERDVETISFYRQGGVPVRCIEEPFAPDPVYRLALWLPASDRVAVETRLLRSFSEVEVLSGGDRFLDILPKGVSKGAALERFIEDLPERPEVIVAAGDHKNDFTMLNCADIAAVPQNADAEVLALADVVFPAAAENGIAALMERLLSGGILPSGRVASHN
ncbi:MAG: Cof-type HAD-IIB family hydrolase [Synergistaceae bacterium]|jgi:Cof subfamily protein (haloacid dehalogenase superfamily)|nr:Cof-type HAD-IIB family hydrolase [Synergistaceae bacterium]